MKFVEVSSELEDELFTLDRVQIIFLSSYFIIVNESLILKLATNFGHLKNNANNR